MLRCTMASVLFRNGLTRFESADTDEPFDWGSYRNEQCEIFKGFFVPKNKTGTKRIARNTYPGMGTTRYFVRYG